MKHVFIVNPVAGKTNIKKTIEAIKGICNKYRLDFEIMETDDIGDAKLLSTIVSQIYKKCTIYSVGGDGTLNEVVNGIHASDSILGVIPTGSGNDFFKMFDTDLIDINSIIERTINGTIDNVNLGLINNQHFVNVASIGIDAETASKISFLKKLKITPSLIYMVALFSTFLTYKCPKVRISFNDMSYEQKIMLVAICNGRYYGNGLPIAPRADYNDNLFDVYIVDKLNKLRVPSLSKELKNAEHEKYIEVHPFRTDRVLIETEKPLKCNIDGEIIVDTEFKFEIADKKLKVLRPKKVTYQNIKK